MQPKARSERITVRELPGELLIYDHTQGKAHCLNGTSAWVWKHCDGETSAAALAEQLRTERNIPVALPLVRLALEQLSRRHLLEAEIVPLQDTARLSRREALRKLVIAAVALPLIMTISAPKAQAAVSIVEGVTCGGAGDGTACGEFIPPFATLGPGGNLVTVPSPGFSGLCCKGRCLPASSFQTDPFNCGKCGNRCPEGNFCLAGECKSSAAFGNCVSASQPCGASAGGAACCPGTTCNFVPGPNLNLCV